MGIEWYNNFIRKYFFNVLFAKVKQSILNGFAAMQM